MTRKRISIVIDYGYFLLVPIALVGIINLVEIFSIEESEFHTQLWLPITFLIILSIVFFLVRYLIDTNPKIEFDQTTIYIGPDKVELKSIYSLKMTTTHFLNRYKIEVRYIRDNGEDSYFTFFPRILYMNLDELINNIASQNPKAKLQKIFKGPFLIEKNKN